jgi:2',3'-cyclic-nucleotide 2'-phosphodiesterase (5'-nucleotidase family)
MKHFFYVLSFIIFTTFACKPLRTPTSINDDGKLEVVFLQVNDVYEISPVSGGKSGGLARVHTLKKQYLKSNSNTYLVMAGDFLSPSVYNSLMYEGKRIRGRQMVDVMNSAGMDLVMFGNHEFDFSENDLLDRINESEFQWIASNAFHKLKDSIVPFAKIKAHASLPIPEYIIMRVKDKDGTTANIGIIGLTIPINKAEYVSYSDPLTTAKNIYNKLKDSVDAFVAITHQYIDDDKKLAAQIPGITVILGGHEHRMIFEKEAGIYITKAHSNARSAYIVKLQIDKNSKQVKVLPELKYIDETIALDTATNGVVQKWENIAERNYNAIGFDPKKIAISDIDSLDGREENTYQRPTNLTRLIVAAMVNAAPLADIDIFNSGAIRNDEILQMPLTQFDFLRILPFGGGIREVDMKASLLIKTLDQGKNNKGGGGFLQYNENLTYDENNKQWKLKGLPIDPVKIYRVAMTDFLLTGREVKLNYLHPTNPEIVKIYEAQTSVSSDQSDIRLAIIRYLEKKNNAPNPKGG